MMIFMYIASLKHLSCQIFKEMDKIRIIGFHQPSLYTIFFDDPHIPKRHPQISPNKFYDIGYISRDINNST